VALCVVVPTSGCGDTRDRGSDPTPSADAGDLSPDSSPDPDATPELRDASPSSDSSALYGEAQEGMYHLGPVDFAESEWHNACAPGGGYRPELVAATGLGGEFLAGVGQENSQGGGICDACILIRTGEGRSVVARVVTYGVSNAAGDLDVSPSVYAALNLDEWPRDMRWQLAACPDTGGLVFEFQTEANVWWTSLWVRNPRVPVASVEVKSTNHPSYVALRRSGDGTLTDDAGFGEGAFSLRVTAIDGQVVEVPFAGFEAGELVSSTQQFR